MQPILKIDLSTGTTEKNQIPEKWERDFLGGASLAARILYSSLTRKLDPLSAEAPLLFMMGPMTGTSGPTTGRFVVCGKGPATGLWAESNVGGFWGPELRAAGYDGLWITGRAAEPVYLWLDKDRLEIRSAAHLWGQNTYTTQEMVKQDVGEKLARVCVIGPAGERGVLLASILCDHGRMSGRTGLLSLCDRPACLGRTGCNGYRLTNIFVSPVGKIVFSSDPELVNNLPGYVETQTIDLTGKEDDFETLVELNLPPGNSVIGDPKVLVQVSIAAIESSLAITLPVEVIGLAPGLGAIAAPAMVDVILTGPVPVLNALGPGDVRVVVDLTGYDVGTYQLIPMENILPEQVAKVSMLLSRPYTSR